MAAGVEPGERAVVEVQVPAWYRRAMSAPVTTGVVRSAGCAIAYRAWGPAGAPGLVLVHGGAAHSRWWDHVAPLLAAGRRVVAPDLSGHGDSDRRDRYHLDLWVAEVMAAARAAEAAGRPVVVGHSMGGYVALRAGAVCGDELTGVVAVDSAMRRRTPEEDAALERRAFGPLRVYETWADARRRFRPVPDVDPVLDFVVDHIARTSIRRTEGGWTWKYDPAIFGRERSTPVARDVLACRAALFRAELGLLTEEDSDHVYDRLGRRAPVVELPDTSHHAMLDRPLTLVAALRTLLADWEHTIPKVRDTS